MSDSVLLSYQYLEVSRAEIFVKTTPPDVAEDTIIAQKEAGDPATGLHQEFNEEGVVGQSPVQHEFGGQFLRVDQVRTALALNGHRQGQNGAHVLVHFLFEFKPKNECQILWTEDLVELTCCSTRSLDFCTLLGFPVFL